MTLPALTTTVSSPSIGAPAPALIEQQIDRLVEIWRAHPESQWSDPLSQNIRAWGSRSFATWIDPQTGEVTASIQKMITCASQLDQILVDFIWQKPLDQTPLLLQNRYVVKESDLRLLMANLDPEIPSPLALEPRRVHEFALALLNWRKRPMQSPCEKQASSLDYYSLIGQIHERTYIETTQMQTLEWRGHAENIQEQATRQKAQEDVRFEQLKQRLQQIAANNKKEIASIHEKIEMAEKEMMHLRQRLLQAEALNEEHSRKIADLERRVTQYHAEIAALRAAIDDDDGGCSIQ